MKMAIRMPDAMKIEREEIDENDGLNPNRYRRSSSKHLDFRRDEGMSLEKEFHLRIGNIRQYMTEALALDPERVQAIKDRLQNRYRRTESECRLKIVLTRIDLLP
jgi:uncharacterized protein YicC (UPF0701 family)